MGLSGRREKQRIPNDPRNLSWADNATKFGQAYLSKLGWDSSKGLGVEGDGRTSHIKVSQKLDMLGIGAAHSKDVNGIAWKQNKEFEELLKRLNESAGDVDQGEENERENKKRKKDDIGDDEKKKKRRKEKSIKSKQEPADLDTSQSGAQETITLTATAAPAPRPAHRARFIASKNLASKSASAISEILGIAPTPSLASLLPTPTPTPTQGALTQLDENHNLDKLTTSTKSVADYFKERLLAKGTDTRSLPSSGHEDDAPRSGLGSSRLRFERMDRESAPGLGLGISKFGSLMSGAFLDSLSTATAADGQVIKTDVTGTPEREGGNEERKKKKSEKSKREKKKSVENDDSPEDREARRREKNAKKERSKQKDMITDAQEKIMALADASIPSSEEARKKAERKAAKRARRET